LSAAEIARHLGGPLRASQGQLRTIKNGRGHGVKAKSNVGNNVPKIETISDSKGSSFAPVDAELTHVKER
ncbi:MAG: hypothetical protein ACE5PO_07085, partial [Candidatus Bathyarchaeia archaeon]